MKNLCPSQATTLTSQTNQTSKAKKSNCGRERLALRSWGEMHKTLGESYGAPSEFRTLPAKCCKMLQFSCWLAGCDINLASSFVNFWARHSKCGHRSLLQPLNTYKIKHRTADGDSTGCHISCHDQTRLQRKICILWSTCPLAFTYEATWSKLNNAVSLFFTVAIELNCFIE